MAAALGALASSVRVLAWGTLVTSALVALASSAWPGPGATPLVRIIYSTDTLGQVDTCGCSGGQHGGFPRRATVLRGLSDGGIAVVPIDGGGLLTAPYQAPYFAQAYGLMGYRLLVLDPAEAQGREPAGVEASFREHGVHVIWRPAAGGTGPLPCWIADAGGSRLVAIAGPSGPEEAPGSVADRVRATVPPPDGAPTVVLLSTLRPAPANHRLAAELGDAVDVIVGASTPAQTRDYRDPIPEGKVVPAISQGKALTVIDVYVEPDGRKRIEARFEPVSPNLLEDPTTKAIVERYYSEAAPASRPAEAPKDTVDYVMRGWADAETCGTCHPKELEAWKGTAHAKAIATLAQAGRLVDECLACHSEEFRQRKAFDPVRLVPGDGVTCATCHGDGLIHSMTGRMDYIRRSMEARDCMACHNEERQPAGFDFAASHEKIRHLPVPAGAKAE